MTRAPGLTARRLGPPSGHPDHQLLRVKHSAPTPLGLPRGSLLHVDCSRNPRNGDLVWVELVLAQDRVRLVRRYQELGGVVTLAAPVGEHPWIMRRIVELVELGWPS